MSSPGFETIFDHAAGLVRAQCGELPGIEAVIADLRQRSHTDTLNPLQNRDLIIEPHIDAQMLEVPSETVERVASQLHKLNIFHVWARATCPWENGETVVETDDPKVFRATLQDSCPHCGKTHDDLSWDNIETFYAFNFASEPDTFKFRHFFRPPRPLPRPVTDAGGSTRCSWACSILTGGIRRFFVDGPKHLLKRSLRPYQRISR